MKRIHLKPEAQNTGFYYLDHTPTGKVYTGTSKDMQADILALRDALQSRTCREKKLVKAFTAEDDFKAYTRSYRTLREAKQHEAAFRKGLPLYLLLN